MLPTAEPRSALGGTKLALTIVRRMKWVPFCAGNCWTCPFFQFSEPDIWTCCGWMSCSVRHTGPLHGCSCGVETAFLFYCFCFQIAYLCFLVCSEPSFETPPTWSPLPCNSGQGHHTVGPGMWHQGQVPLTHLCHSASSSEACPQVLFGSQWREWLVCSFFSVFGGVFLRPFNLIYRDSSAS